MTLTVEFLMSQLANSVEYFQLKSELHELTNTEQHQIKLEYQMAFKCILANELSKARGFINRAEVLMH